MEVSSLSGVGGWDDTHPASVSPRDLLGLLDDFRVGSRRAVAAVEETEELEFRVFHAVHAPEWEPVPSWSAHEPGIPAAPPAAPPPPAAAPPPAPLYHYPTVPIGENPTASVAMGLGLGSLLIPLLSIPGLILGIKALRRSNRQPWAGGRGKAITGIVTSLLLGPIVAVVVGIAAFNMMNHEDMGKVKSLIGSMVTAQVQPSTGPSPDLQVQCPSSEPRRSGTTFYCQVNDLDNGRSVTMQVRETDNAGDVIVSVAPSEPS